MWGDYYKGMNIFIQYDNPDIDPFNNKYFQIKVYTSTDPSTQEADLTNDPRYRLVKCSRKEIQKYFKENAKFFYDKLVCFDQPDQVKIQSDWWTGKPYLSVVIAFEQCRNTANITCASSEETNIYFDKYPITLKTGQLSFARDVFADNLDVKHYKDAKYKNG